jgi:hypothetical protein
MHSRRSFLQQALALGAGSFLLPTGLARAATSGKKPPFLVVVVAAGGWDTTYCLDPKYSNDFVHGPDADPDGGDESIATYGYDLQVMVNDNKRPSVSSFFDKYGTQSTIVSGIEVGSVAHRSCMDRMLTGTRAGTTAPDFAAIVGSTYGSERPLACVDMCGQSRAGPLAASVGRIGANSQIVTLLDRSDAFYAPPEYGVQYPQIVPTTADEDGLESYLTQRLAALEAKRSGGGKNADHMASYRESMLRKALIQGKSEQLLDNLRLGQTAAHADLSQIVTGLFTNGICQSVILDSSQSWDTHTVNTNQHESYDGLFEMLEGMVDAIDAAGIFDDTVVVVVSELGRMPSLNDDLGKDHWPVTSALLVGPRVGTGRALGGTTSTLAARTVDLQSGEVDDNSGTAINYENFTAGLLQALDVDPEDWISEETQPLGIV